MTYHSSVRGDTQSSIARRYGITRTRLLQANTTVGWNMGAGVGWNFCIPSSNGGGNAGGSGGARTATGYFTHSSVRGDTQSSIARRYGITVAQLLAANPTVKSWMGAGIGWQFQVPVFGNAPAAAAAPAPAPAVAAPAQPAVSDCVYTGNDWINSARAAVGLGGLGQGGAGDACAWSQRQAREGRMFHSGVSCGEIVGYSSNSYGDLPGAWLASPSHYAVITHSAPSNAAMAYAQNLQTGYWYGTGRFC